MIRDYGEPIYIMNLIRSKETWKGKAREGQLNEEFNSYNEKVLK